ncbi:YceI family protein [Algoriphagus limi]|uniref:YceI family protein n=1 Tax=Algoriphagus limi TaxID=2975273 RepID=A0ABT2G5Z0_9BACT|nr:YceI family protein [Algoriphagus limi]MCS5490685.1 YceI family protein [Algoriphagus limi]
MKKLSTLSVILAFLLGFNLSQSMAQQTFKVSDVAELKVSGTSTLHDWDMVAENGVAGQAILKVENGKIAEIQSLNLILETKALKSGKSSMDKNAYEAIKADDFPKITFQLTKVEQLTPTGIKARGKLNLAGNVREITLDVSYTVKGDNVIFLGKQDITFEQFSLEPPTAVFGTIKTGNELTLSFNTTYSLKN